MIRKAIARRPIAAFLILGNGVYFVVLLTPLVGPELPWFDVPVHAIVGGMLGVGLAAFVVTAATDGRRGVVDLVARTLRWRVPLRWYALALFGVPVAATVVAAAIYGTEVFASPAEGWLHVVGAVLALFVVQAVFFQFAEEVGFTGFLQDRLRDRYGVIKLSAVVALAWAFWHIPADYLAEEGGSVLELLVGSLVIFAFEFSILFFARLFIVWLYEGTGRSVLLVILFHASFDATISRLAEELIPSSDVIRFFLVSGIVVSAGAAVMVAAWRRRPSGAPSKPAATAPSA